MKETDDERWRRIIGSKINKEDLKRHKKHLDAMIKIYNKRKLTHSYLIIFQFCLVIILSMFLYVDIIKQNWWEFVYDSFFLFGAIVLIIMTIQVRKRADDECKEYYRRRRRFQGL